MAYASSVPSSEKYQIVSLGDVVPGGDGFGVAGGSASHSASKGTVRRRLSTCELIATSTVSRPAMRSESSAVPSIPIRDTTTIEITTSVSATSMRVNPRFLGKAVFISAAFVRR